MDYFIETERECQDYIKKMDLMMGYPNPRTGVVTYAKPIKHDAKTGIFLVPIKAVWAPKLKRKAKITDIDKSSTAGEISKRKTRTALETEKAFSSRSIKKV